QAYAAVGDGFQRLGDQAVDGARAVAGQVPAQFAVDLADVGAAVDHEAAVVLGVDGRLAQAGLGGELTDDLLEDVLEGDQADHLAVLVDHHAHAPLELLEVDQLG